MKQVKLTKKGKFLFSKSNIIDLVYSSDIPEEYDLNDSFLNYLIDNKYLKGFKRYVEAETDVAEAKLNKAKLNDVKAKTHLNGRIFIAGQENGFAIIELYEYGQQKRTLRIELPELFTKEGFLNDKERQAD